MQRQRVTKVAAGSVLVLCGLLAALSVGRVPDLWPVTVWLAVAGVGIAGAGILVRRAVRPAAAVGLVFGAQLAGHGIVGVRNWFNAVGAGTLPEVSRSATATAVAFAALLAMTGTAATCVAVGLLWREPSRGWLALIDPRRPGFGVLAVVTPFAAVALLAGRWGSAEASGIGSIALPYTLPWAAGLGVAAWLGRRAAVVGGLTVLASVAVTFGHAAVLGTWPTA